MARLIPAIDIEPSAVGGRSETATLQALARDLPDDYWIFHHRHWTLDNANYTDFGELDFVVINTSGDVLFIEQKNGPLQETEGLVKQYERGKGKNVAAQIHRAIDLVHRKFQEQHPGQALSPTYLICCPDHHITNLNSVGLERRHIVDAAEYPHIGRKVEDLLPVREEANETRFRTLMDFFTDVYHLVPDIHAQIEAQSEFYLRHRGTLADYLANLEMDPVRLRVRGIAGCGKSLLAASMYENRCRRGERVLFTCFNRSLAERLKARLRSGGYVNTFHGFCTEFLKSRGVDVDFAQSGQPGFWQGLIEKVQEQDIGADWTFTTLIVDEGQDFDPEWHQILRLFVPESGNTFWFEDPHQNIYEKQPVPPPRPIRTPAWGWTCMNTRPWNSSWPWWNRLSGACARMASGMKTSPSSVARACKAPRSALSTAWAGSSSSGSRMPMTPSATSSTPTAAWYSTASTASRATRRRPSFSWRWERKTSPHCGSSDYCSAG